MKHPSDEEWMDWLFGEAEEPAARLLSAHRQQCPNCDRRVRTWEQTRRQLDRSRTVRPLTPSTVVRPRQHSSLRWAAAAAVMGIGLLTGWFSRSAASAGESDRLRAELQSQWERQLAAARSDILSEMKAEIELNRAADSAVFVAAIQEIRGGYIEQMSQLREDLEVIALNTQASLELAEKKLVQIALDPILETNPKP